MRPAVAAICSCACLIASAAETSWAAQSYKMQSGAQPGETSGVEIKLELGGKVKLEEKGKIQQLPISVAGNLQYEERLLGLAADDPYHRRSARHYSAAGATIKIDKSQHQPSIREDRRLITVDLVQDQPTIASPMGPLSRDELDLVNVIGNSLLLELLLPKDAVEVGDSWQHDERLLAMLLTLDAVKQADVTSKLDEVAGELCKMTLTGTVHGAVGGVATEIKIQARYNFHLGQRRITWFAAAIEEDRSVGHVGPGLDIVAKVRVQITPSIRPRELSDDLIAELPAAPPAGATVLEYVAKPAGFRLLHDPRWHVTKESADLAVMRYVDRGELVAQCNVSALKRLPRGTETTLADFQTDIKQALGESFSDFSAAAESTLDDGSKLLRAVATGTVGELQIQWNYYLVARPTGERVAFAFTVEPELVERLQEADRQLVAGLELLESSTAQQATPALRK